MSQPLLQQTGVSGFGRLVAGAVVYAAGRVLVVRRSPDEDFLPRIEELPSGGCEPGETIGQALTRELQEEIGWHGPVEIETGFATHFDYLTRSGVAARQYTFSVPLGEQVIRLSPEHSSWRWLGRDAVDSSDMTEESKRTVAEWWARYPPTG